MANYQLNKTGAQIQEALDNATKVVANPIVTASDSLTKITIGNTTYTIEGGGSNTYQTFPVSWITNGTTAQFCASVDADATATAGMAYLGELRCSDLPFNGNADAVVEIIDGTGTSNKVIHIVITSGDIAPYRWEYTYWNSGTNVSGWIPFLYAPPYPQENGTYEIVMTKTNAGVSFNWATASSEEQVYGEIITDTYGG